MRTIEVHELFQVQFAWDEDGLALFIDFRLIYNQLILHISDLLLLLLPELFSIFERWGVMHGARGAARLAIITAKISFVLLLSARTRRNGRIITDSAMR